MEVPLREVHLEYTISPDYESEKALRFLMTLIFSQKFFLILTKRLLLRIITKLKRRIFPELNFLVKDFFQKREYRIVTKIFTKCNPLQLSAVDNNLKLRWHVSDPIRAESTINFSLSNKLWVNWVRWSGHDGGSKATTNSLAPPLKRDNKEHVTALSRMALRSIGRPWYRFNLRVSSPYDTSPGCATSFAQRNLLRGWHAQVAPYSTPFRGFMNTPRAKISEIVA